MLNGCSILRFLVSLRMTYFYKKASPKFRGGFFNESAKGLITFYLHHQQAPGSKHGYFWPNQSAFAVLQE